MLRKMTGIAMTAYVLGALAGCYSVPVGKMCEVCESLKEGKAEGAEWSGEYIHHKFQCKLEGGKVKLQIEDYWKEC